MAEQVQTGGVMSFHYSGAHKPQRIPEKDKRDIDIAYARADERKRRERRNRVIGWIIAVLLALILLFLFFRFL